MVVALAATAAPVLQSLCTRALFRCTTLRTWSRLPSTTSSSAFSSLVLYPADLDTSNYVHTKLTPFYSTTLHPTHCHDDRAELVRSSDLHEKHTAELQRQLSALSDTNLQLLSALKELELKLMESVAAREQSDARLSRVLSLLDRVSFEGEEKPWMGKVSAALNVLRP